MYVFLFFKFFIFAILITGRRHDAETSSDLESFDESDTETASSESKDDKKKKKKKKKNTTKVVLQPVRRPSVLAAPGRNHYGSFYLRMGAVGKCCCDCSI